MKEFFGGHIIIGRSGLTAPQQKSEDNTENTNTKQKGVNYGKEC